jgi:GntR family transcriptional regulator, histidine utilization repressor
VNGRSEPDGRLPPFEQLRRHLAAQIRSGAIAPGAVLPSARSLAAVLNLHATTVGRAYRRLAAEGLVSHVRGTRRWAASAELPPRTIGISGVELDPLEGTGSGAHSR